MLTLRPITEQDLPNFIQLIQTAGPGLTSLPADENFLAKRIALSVESFARDVSQRKNEYYIFVLVDSAAPTILLGTSALKASMGYDIPIYSYACEKLSDEVAILNYTPAFNGHTELCGLFLSLQARKSQNGVLLSKGRFLFMAQQAHRFSNQVVAEIRGVSNQYGYSPFWQALGSQFYPMSFSEADYHMAIGTEDIVKRYHPKQSIYENLLPSTARAVLGQPHRNARPALAMLKHEGFVQTEHVNLFDAGPFLYAKTDNIRALNRIKTVSLQVREAKFSENFLVATTDNFRATILSGVLEGETLFISAADDEALSVNTVVCLRITA